MPNCDFYATPDDHEGILSWLFAEKMCHVYKLASDYERPLQRFYSSAEVLAQFDRTYSNGEKWKCVTLQLYVLGTGSEFTPRRVPLNPKYCHGTTFRYAADDWGLVQLYLGTLTRNGLGKSHTNHNTQVRAKAWESVVNNLSSVDSWDFKTVTAFSSRLNREIRKRSSEKHGSCAVLPGALKLLQSGIALLP